MVTVIGREIIPDDTNVLLTCGFMHLFVFTSVNLEKMQKTEDI